MKLKILTLIIAFTFIGCSFISSANPNYNDLEQDDIKTKEIDNFNNLEIIDVKVAVLEHNNPFTELLEYEWVVGNKKYKFDMKIVTDKDLIRGKLTTKEFDMIVVPGGGVGDREASIRCFPTYRNYIWKRNFARFIKDGGGYYGVCGGAA